MIIGNLQLIRSFLFPSIFFQCFPLKPASYLFCTTTQGKQGYVITTSLRHLPTSLSARYYRIKCGLIIGVKLESVLKNQKLTSGTKLLQRCLSSMPTFHPILWQGEVNRQHQHRLLLPLFTPAMCLLIHPCNVQRAHMHRERHAQCSLLAHKALALWSS